MDDALRCEAGEHKCVSTTGVTTTKQPYARVKAAVRSAAHLAVAVEIHHADHLVDLFVRHLRGSEKR